MEEQCGIITDSKIYHLKNESTNKKEYFYINPIEYFDINKREDCKIIWHSHPTKTENPSFFDIISQKNSEIPYLIYGAKTNRFFYLDELFFFSFVV